MEREEGKGKTGRGGKKLLDRQRSLRKDRERRKGIIKKTEKLMERQKGNEKTKKKRSLDREANEKRKEMKRQKVKERNY